LNVSLQDAYTQKSKSNDPNAAVMGAWQNRDKNVGFLFTGVFDKRDIRRDGVEGLGYEPLNGVLFPSLIDSALFQQERERKACDATLQLRPSDRLEINVNGFYSRFGADNINRNYLAWGHQAIGGGGTLTNTTIEGDTAVAGTIASTPGG